ncbi:MAG: tetratricopeptide repeat protein [Nitrospirae bacterium]|nr:MAG: tetratricopeptide repeat protein [Nitrospirota bacterium]
MRIFSMIVTSLLLVVLPACSSTEKPKPRLPLPVSSSAPQAVVTATQQGMRAYQEAQYQEAKTQFELAVTGAPNSAESHYNLGLALFALGETDQAREQFMEAANLAPGNKVIWDSPALRPFGSPDSTIPKKTKEDKYSTQRPSFGGVGPR